MSHTPVLLDEVLHALIPDGRIPQRVIDGTLGAGGHTRALIEQGVPHVLGLDVDSQAIELATHNLEAVSDHVQIVNRSYLHMQEEAQRLGWDKVDGILLDFGVSSMQLDTPERGFAFRHVGPLDMRFHAGNGGITADEIVNTWSEQDLADIFYRYGEERQSRRVAKAVVQSRPHQTTQGLAQVIETALPRPKKGKSIHPATQVFQALRIAVNDELQAVETILPCAIDLLATGGRLAVISFHSLEDRIVKTIFKEASKEIVSPPGMASIESKPATVKLITRKPIVAKDAEITENPRSRSAKLRVVEKL